MGFPFRLKELRTFVYFPLSQHTAFYFPPSDESDGPPLSPERETCCMLFISEAMAFLLSLSVSSSVMLSFVPTYCNQLSPASFGLAVRLTADRPTMHRKFWRISSFKELWAMKRILSLHSRKELRIARFPCVSLSILNFYKRIFLFTPAICKDCTVSRIQYGFPQTANNVYGLTVPLSLQNGKRSAGFPLVKFLHFIFPSVN